MNEEICTRDSNTPNVLKIDSCMPYANGNEKGFDIHSVLTHLTQYADMSSVVASIKKGSRYVVQIPVEYRDDLKSGKKYMLKKKETGEMLATIMEKDSGGKSVFCKNCPIKEEAFYQGNPFRDFANGFVSMQIQRQIEALALQLEETYNAVLRIEAGQKADRIGQLNAGRDGIIHALRMKDDEGRKLAIISARRSLLEAQGKIAETLRQRIFEFKPVPSKGLRRFIEHLKHSDCLDRCDDEYNAIQDYFDLYMQATELVAESYAICRETESVVSTWDACRQFIMSLDFSNVKTILYAHRTKTEDDLFYAGILPYIAENKKLCLESAKQCDYLEITFSGEEMLEGLGYV